MQDGTLVLGISMSLQYLNDLMETVIKFIVQRDVLVFGKALGGKQ
jgi:hypothetical protein